MTVVLEAVFENGVFRPTQPVALEEGTPVRLTLQTADDLEDPMEGVLGIGEGPPEGDGAQNHDKYIYGKLGR